MKWGILSTAEITGKVAPALQSAADSELGAIASRSLEKAQAWADKHCPTAKAYGSYDELLQDDSIDAVYIPLVRQTANGERTTAAHQHFPDPSSAFFFSSSCLLIRIFPILPRPSSSPPSACSSAFSRSSLHLSLLSSSGIFPFSRSLPIPSQVPFEMSG